MTRSHATQAGTTNNTTFQPNWWVIGPVVALIAFWALVGVLVHRAC